MRISPSARETRSGDGLYRCAAGRRMRKYGDARAAGATATIPRQRRPSMVESYLERFVLSGGFMMVFLIPTSFLALVWIAQGFIRLRRGRVMPSSLSAAAHGLSDAKSAGEFHEVLAGHASPLGRLAAHLLRLNVVGVDPKAIEEEQEHLRPALNDEVDRLWQETTGLVTIYTVAPLMGLLGTVIGMIRTFYEFTNNPEHSIASLSTGINQALVTTMWGLFIAIPAFIFVQILRRRIFRYEKDLLPRAARELAQTVWERAQAGDGEAA
jgi:biopolymer transport protein ExbB